jgi:hypothetical protein
MLENAFIVNSASLVVALVAGCSQIIQPVGPPIRLWLDVIQRQVIVGATEVASFAVTLDDAQHLKVLLMRVWMVHGFQRPWQRPTISVCI